MANLFVKKLVFPTVPLKEHTASSTPPDGAPANTPGLSGPAAAAAPTQRVTIPRIRLITERLLLSRGQD
ncbi:hypothetical protein BIW11_08544 [Tropilaelaps mercedesae]|uniref:Uncharacterized protein n=1 Tax=Tropilaelaps mercedesae TaxID=418985 RepID=A0A1V9XP10_9ACAR|nr:hypothetical protein BIW11_08544 [Tropilaelaps mercedesae]